MELPSSTREALLTTYERQGCAVVRGVVDAALIQEANHHVDWLLARHPDLRADQLGHELMRDDPFWYRLIADDRLVEIASLFVGDDVGLFASHYICKEPQVGRAVPWHQDGGYWPLEPMDVVSLWLALTHSDSTNGAVEVIPGSHRSALMELVETGRDEVLGREVPSPVDESSSRTLALRPGDVSVHHANIVHGSKPNRSDKWRRGLTIRYIATSTRILDPSMASPFALRGNPRSDINDWLEPPTSGVSNFPTSYSR